MYHDDGEKGFTGIRRMNILLINHYAGSPAMGMEFRPYYFAREWVKKGHRVDIIAASYSHLRIENPRIKHDFEGKLIDGIHYHWIKTNKYAGNGVSRAVTMAQFVGKLWVNAGRIAKKLKPDIIITSSTYPIDTYAGQRIKRKSKKDVKLIHEVHDMWPISPMEIGGMSPHHPFIKIMQMGEDSFCRHSDYVVSLLPAAKDYFIEHGMKPGKFVYVPNGVVLEEWNSPEPLEEKIVHKLAENKEKGKYNLCFFGSIHKTYNLDILIQAVIQRKDADVFVAFIGPGLDKQELMQMAKGYEDRFAFFDPIPKKQIPSLFEYVDAVFVGAKSQKIFRFGICMNKLFDAMMGGKPIIYMVDAPNNFIEQYHCGIVVDGNDEKAINRALDKALQLSEDEKKEMGENGKSAVMKRFNYPNLADRFLSKIGK